MTQTIIFFVVAAAIFYVARRVLLSMRAETKRLDDNFREAVIAKMVSIGYPPEAARDHVYSIENIYAVRQFQLDGFWMRIDGKLWAYGQPVKEFGQ